MNQDLYKAHRFVFDIVTAARFTLDRSQKICMVDIQYIVNSTSFSVNKVLKFKVSLDKNVFKRYLTNICYHSS